MANSEMRAIREALEMTLEELSARVNISVSQLARFETGGREPRVSEMRRIAEALNVPLSRLIPDLENGYVSVGILRDKLIPVLLGAGFRLPRAQEIVEDFVETAQPQQALLLPPGRTDRDQEI